MAIAVGVILSVLEKNLLFFYYPDELNPAFLKEGQIIRVGGLVEKNSVIHRENGLVTEFSIRGQHASIMVSYRGILPNLFREGQGVIAKGYFDITHHFFIADEILAKHDETYMPAELVDSIKQSGYWHDDDTPTSRQ